MCLFGFIIGEILKLSKEKGNLSLRKDFLIFLSGSVKFFGEPLGNRRFHQICSLLLNSLM